MKLKKFLKMNDGKFKNIYLYNKHKYEEGLISGTIKQCEDYKVIRFKVLSSLVNGIPSPDLFILLKEPKQRNKMTKEKLDRVVDFKNSLPEKIKTISSKEIKNDRCPKCGVNKAAVPHHCSYKTDINDDNESVCVCCEECQNECAQDI